MNSKSHLARITSSQSHRESMKRSLLTDLVVNEHMTSTSAKIKSIVPMFDRVVNYALKQEERAARRYLNSIFNNSKATDKVLGEFKNRFDKVNGGYLQIFKLGNRKGDNAPMQKVIVKGYEYKGIGELISTSSKTKKEAEKSKKDTSGKSTKSKTSAKKTEKKPATKKKKEESK